MIKPAILQSPQDKRLYRLFTLPNQLRVLVISDPEMASSDAPSQMEAIEGESPAEEEDSDDSCADAEVHMLTLQALQSEREE